MATKAEIAKAEAKIAATKDRDEKVAELPEADETRGVLRQFGVGVKFYVKG